MTVDVPERLCEGGSAELAREVTRSVQVALELAHTIKRAAVTQLGQCADRTRVSKLIAYLGDAFFLSSALRINVYNDETFVRARDNAQSVADLLDAAHAVAVKVLTSSNLGQQIVSSIRNGLRCAQAIALELDLARQSVSRATRVAVTSTEAQVTWISSRLNELAVRVLPTGYQADYREEFSSELCDLALRQRGWWTQVWHSLRVLVWAPQLRRELRATVPAVWERER